MKIFSAILIAVFGLALSTAAFGQKQLSNFVPGELLVKFKAGSTAVASQTVLNSLGAVALEDLGDTGWKRIKLPSSISMNDAIIELTRSMDIEGAQPNFYYHLLQTPNDTRFNDAGMYGLQKISAPSAWDLSTGSSSVVVADIDTGARYTHEDLAANIWNNPGEIPGNGIDDDGNGFVDDYHGWDMFFNDSDPLDENGHGTHTAGTIGAVGNNGVGVVGVNWNVKIMVIKIYNSSGFGTTSAMLVNAYNYVRLMKNRGINIRVTNNSYGGCDEACGYDQATKDAIDLLADAGVLQVFAAGNDNSNNETTPFYPANYNSPGIISVAASTTTDAAASFSNYGVNSVDLAAPGSGILSTTWGSNSSYGSLSGTSMATPHVTGAAALLSAFNPSLSPASLKASLDELGRSAFKLDNTREKRRSVEHFSRDAVTDRLYFRCTERHCYGRNKRRRIHNTGNRRTELRLHGQDIGQLAACDGFKYI